MGKSKDKYTDNSVLDVDFFREDINSMYDDVATFDELGDVIYDDVKKLYLDKKKDSEGFMFTGKGTLTFVSEQLKTLATVRTSRANAMNQIIANKLKVSQLALNKQKNNQGGTGSSSEEIANIFKKIFAENVTSTLTPSQQVKANASVGMSEDVDAKLSERVKELEESGELKFTANERAIKYERDGYTFKVAMNDGKLVFVPVNSATGEIITDLPESLYPDESKLLNATIRDNIVVAQNNIDRFELI